MLKYFVVYFLSFSLITNQNTICWKGEGKDQIASQFLMVLVKDEISISSLVTNNLSGLGYQRTYG